MICFHLDGRIFIAVPHTHTHTRIPGGKLNEIDEARANASKRENCNGTNNQKPDAPDEERGGIDRERETNTN